jgi:hypothetical protein
LKRPFINSNSTVHKEKEMFSFRKAILLLAVLALGASMASAQFPPLSCTLNGGAPPLLRAEGLTEEVGQAFIQCTGGNPGNPGTINIRVFTPGFTITSRALSGAYAGKLEAALLIDDPLPGAVNVGVNAFFADPVAGIPNAVEWTNIQFIPPGTGTRTLRMVNIRVNASSAPALTPVNLLVSITGSLTLPITSPFLAVGYVQQSLDVSVTGANLSQCLPPSPVLITFTELIPNAWRSAGNTTAQNNLNQIYNSESMFWDTAPTNWPADAGRATQATQLRIAFSNLPTGVSIGTPIFGAATDGTTFTASVSGNTITLTVLTASSFAVGNSGTLTVTVPLIFPTPPAVPGLGTGSVAAGYAPSSTVNTPAATPVPRFTTSSAATTAFTISPCETRLLFPFVTSQAGFDTGIAISNTTVDPFNTPAQSGPCTLFFYSATAGNSSQTSASIAAGAQLIMTMSGGNSQLNLNPVPNFTGYMIARCNFQYAHGYAFISDLGSTRLAQGYIALVIGGGLTNRFALNPSEALNQ